MCLTIMQCEALARLVRDGRRFDAVAVHPFSGVATLSRDADVVLVEPDGRVTYDSTLRLGGAR